MTQKITYVSVPKCACTSLKMYFFAVENGRPWRRAEQTGRKIGIHRYYPSVPFWRLPRRAIADHHRVAVVRDPVERFASAYDNKVASGIVDRDHSGRILRALGIPTRPEFEDFVRRIRLYQWLSPLVHKHTRPMVDFLGRRADWFHRIYDISETETLVADINARVPGAEAAELQQANPNRISAASEQMTSALGRRIRKLYAEDYSAFGHIFKSNASLASA